MIQHQVIRFGKDLQFHVTPQMIFQSFENPTKLLLGRGVEKGIIGSEISGPIQDNVSLFSLNLSENIKKNLLQVFKVFPTFYKEAQKGK